MGTWVFNIDIFQNKKLKIKIKAFKKKQLKEKSSAHKLSIYVV